MFVVITMPPKKVSHKPLSFEMWKERLKLYAETGQFPAGNHKPVANKQPRAHALFEKVSFNIKISLTQ